MTGILRIPVMYCVWGVVLPADVRPSEAHVRGRDVERRQRVYQL